MAYLGILWILFLISAGIYLFLIFPRFIKKPDDSVLRGVYYAHRGLHDNQSEAPENSIHSFQKAIKAGYGIEFDVRLSKDGIPVIFHDASLKRMCGVKGNVWDYTLEELKVLKLADSQETIPTLENALKTVAGKVPLMVEYKLDTPNTDICEKCDRLLKHYSGVYCVESFHPSAVAWYRKHRPDVIRGQLSRNFGRTEKYQNSLRHLALSYLLTNCLTRPDFIAYDYKDAGMLSLRICRRLGALAVAYTIRDRKAYESVKDEFDLFVFDSFMLR